MGPVPTAPLCNPSHVALALQLAAVHTLRQPRLRAIMMAAGSRAVEQARPNIVGSNAPQGQSESQPRTGGPGSRPGQARDSEPGRPGDEVAIPATRTPPPQLKASADSNPAAGCCRRDDADLSSHSDRRST